MVGPFVISPARDGDPELPERFDEGLLDALQLGRIGRRPPFGIVLVEKIEPRQRVILRIRSRVSLMAGGDLRLVHCSRAIPPGKVSGADARILSAAPWCRPLSVSADSPILPAK